MAVISLGNCPQTAQLGRRVGVFSDVHGEVRALERALDLCRALDVETIILLGDLFDMADQADGCARALAGWSVVGVYGNHEHDLTVAALAGQIVMEPETIELLSRLRERVSIDDALLLHDAEQWAPANPLATMFNRDVTNGAATSPWLTFTGHTHVRAVRNERGPVEIRRGLVRLKENRRYLINPGALAVGQFAVWDRDEHRMHFHQLDDWRTRVIER